MSSKNKIQESSPARLLFKACIFGASVETQKKRFPFLTCVAEKKAVPVTVMATLSPGFVRPDELVRLTVAAPLATN